MFSLPRKILFSLFKKNLTRSIFLFRYKYVHHKDLPAFCGFFNWVDFWTFTKYFNKYLTNLLLLRNKQAEDDIVFSTQSTLSGTETVQLNLEFT